MPNSHPASRRTKIQLPLLVLSIFQVALLLLGTRYVLGGSGHESISGSLYILISLVGLLSVCGTGLLVTLVLRMPISELGGVANIAENISQGHIRIAAAGGKNGQVGYLAGSLEKMTFRLNTTLNSAIVYSNRLFSLGANLNQNADRLAANVNVQAEKAYQIASAAEEMSQSIDEIAHKALSASQTSCTAINVVKESQAAAVEAVQMTRKVLSSTNELSATVEKLNASILAIGDFVTMIENIADQTNLLALNAAIEAARSGEHGRGFAVVADEVRNLASKTIQVTSEISTTIKGVQAESLQTATAMKGTAEDVSKTTDCIHNVRASLDQIAEAFEQVNEQITQIASAVEQQSATTQEVAAGIEHSSSLSKEMGGMAGEVSNEVKALSEITDGLLGVLGTLRLEAHFRGKEVIEALSLKPQIQSMARSKQEDEMRSLIRQYPYIELLYITDANGRQITANIHGGSDLNTSYGSDGFAMDWSKRPWFRGAMDNKASHISDLYLSSATGHFCLTISVPLLDDQKRIKGVLAADMDFEKLCKAQ